MKRRAGIDILPPLLVINTINYGLESHLNLLVSLNCMLHACIGAKYNVL